MLEKNIDTNDEMKRFLISAVFGYDINDEDENYNKLKEACVWRAYLDLARVIPFKYSVDYINKNKEEEIIKNYLKDKNGFKDNIKSILITISNDSNIGKVISNVFDEAKKFEIFEGEFTYGMAQKWVNMYMKYLWLFDISPIDVEKLHIPIDSYIIDALFEKNILTYAECEKSCKELVNGWKGKKLPKTRYSDKVDSWSNWNLQEYNFVLKIIKENKPEDKDILSWENDLWIEQIKKTNQISEMSVE